MADHAIPDGRATRSIFDRTLRRAILVTLVSLVLLGTVVLAESWRAREAALADQLDTDIAGLADIYATSGEAELVSRLQDRTALVPSEGRRAHYWLARAGGEAVLPQGVDWPALDPNVSEAGFLTLPDGSNAYGRATRLGPDLNLAVTREYDVDRAAMWRLALTFLLAAGAIVGVVALLGKRAARKLRRRVDAVNSAFRRQADGQAPDLPEDLAADGRDDEISELTHHSARAITRNASLARTHRHMSDQLAHEVRTPLTHLDNRLAALRAELPEGTDLAPVERSRAEIRDLVTMLESLLDIAASEARVGDMAGLKSFDLSELARDLADLYEDSAEDAGLRLQTDIANGVTMLGERMQIGRLISNLLDNALKYVPEGGIVRLRIAPGPVIEVFDNGPGVPSALRPVLFDRFRASHAVDGKSSHGLGLALVQAIAARHGMEVVLQDTSEGAHFTVRAATERQA